MATKKAKKAKNPQDLTLRNLRALKKRVEEVEMDMHRLLAAASSQWLRLLAKLANKVNELEKRK